ncbi:MAG: cytochrome P450 [Planctomycetota bacterium]|nr:cytochrome P450 [Planctomycetota bacterium]
MNSPTSGCPFSGGNTPASPVTKSCSPSDCGPLPVTHGNLLDFPRDPIACMRELYNQHGNIAALEQDGTRLYFAFGPQYNQQVLSDPKSFHSRFFAIRGPKNSAQRRLTCGLLSMNGEDHKRNRRIVMGPFQKRSIETYCGSLAGLSEQMLEGWRPGQVRNIFSDMTHYMLRVTSSILFGFDQTELAYSIGEKTERWVRMNHDLGMGSMLPNARNPAEYEQLLTQADALEAEILKMIALRRASPTEGNDVLSLLIRAHDDDGAKLTDNELIGQAAILFAAAHLTTANTLTWTLFLLAQHPKVAQELFDELTGVLHGEAPKLEQLEQLPLLDRVINESMRVLPASSYSQRTNPEPMDLGPFHLPAGSMIVFSQFITHHMESLFDQPYRFMPQRWKTIEPSPYAFMPFAAGPKMCIGASLAMMTIRITLATVWQRVRMSVIPGANINGLVTSTMLGPTTGMPMLLMGTKSPYTNSWVRGNIHDLVQLDWPESQRAGKSNVA